MSSLLLVSFENLTSSRRETKTPAEPPTDRPRKPRRTSDVKILQSQKSELGESAIKHLDTRHVLLNRMKPNFNHTPRLLSVALIPHPTHLPILAFKATESNLFFFWKMLFEDFPTPSHPPPDTEENCENFTSWWQWWDVPTGKRLQRWRAGSARFLQRIPWAHLHFPLQKAELKALTLWRKTSIQVLTLTAIQPTVRLQHLLPNTSKWSLVLRKMVFRQLEGIIWKGFASPGVASRLLCSLLIIFNIMSSSTKRNLV